MPKLTLKQVSEDYGINKDTLRSACNKGGLKGEKLGRDWFVTKKQVEKYLGNYRSKPRR